MKRTFPPLTWILCTLLCACLSAFLGAATVWFMSYHREPSLLTSPSQLAPQTQQSMLENLLHHSTTSISDENYRCSGERHKTVGAVIASIMEFNRLNQRNEISYGCSNQVCTVTITECTPFKQHECNTRILKYDVSPDGAIVENSFTCIDMP